MTEFPGMSAFTGLFSCPECKSVNHFSYRYLSGVESLDEKKKCSHCGAVNELRAYKVKARSYRPKV